MRKAGIILCFLAASVITEVHWTVMQSITWVSMIHVSDSSATLGEKILSTISGEAPCQHCEALLAEQRESRSEVLSMIGQAPLLGPIPQPRLRSTRSDIFLFSLSEIRGLNALSSILPALPPPERIPS